MEKRTKLHDPESTMRAGVSTEASGVDAVETMASTGDEERAFEEIAAGTATGLGIDRGEETGTGGLASETPVLRRLPTPSHTFFSATC